HQRRVADAELRVHDTAAARTGEAGLLDGAERLLVELDRLRRPLDRESRGEAVVPRRDRLDAVLRHCLSSCLVGLVPRPRLRGGCALRTLPLSAHALPEAQTVAVAVLDLELLHLVERDVGLANDLRPLRLELLVEPAAATDPDVSVPAGLRVFGPVGADVPR